MTAPIRPAAVIFDVDGTLLDSATGIVAGFAHALRTMGIEPPSDAVLRSDLGPPVDEFLATSGVAPERLSEAVLAYRHHYLAEGVRQSTPYPGIVEVLDELVARGVPLGTATAKRTFTARAILDHHGLSGRFAVVNGTTDTQRDKRGTILATLALMEIEPSRDVWMVGDRHSDVAAARALGIRAVAVSWGYGSRAELLASAPDVIIDRPAELLALLGSERGSGPRSGLPAALPDDRIG